MTTQVSETLEERISRAVSFVSKFNGVIVALSAGVDSSLVAAIAYKALGGSAVAVTGQSESLVAEELETAIETAKAIGIRHLVVQTNELKNPNYYENPENRCYYCKQTLYRELKHVAGRYGFEAILDGTHLDDLGDDRPGLKAAREAGVASPLLEARFSKVDVREAARLLGLSVWDKPAMPCLSSRVMHGEEITESKLWMIGQAELFIRKLTGIRDLRVRYASGFARIEVPPRDRRIFFDERLIDQVDEKLRQLGFARVTLDLRGYFRTTNTTPPDRYSLPLVNAGY